MGKKKKDFDDNKKSFEERKYTLLSEHKEYINSSSKLRFKCDGNNEI